MLFFLMQLQLNEAHTPQSSRLIVAKMPEAVEIVRFYFVSLSFARTVRVEDRQRHRSQHLCAILADLFVQLK